MKDSIEKLIDQLQLEPHPEGGYFKETYRNERVFHPVGFDGERSMGTSIFFLLKEGQVSAMHRIKSDEIWYHHLGGALEITEIDESGHEILTVLGSNIEHGELLQYVVKAGRWFGSRPREGSGFCLVGCQVSPGFDFKDFELK